MIQHKSIHAFAKKVSIATILILQGIISSSNAFSTITSLTPISTSSTLSSPSTLSLLSQPHQHHHRRSSWTTSISTRHRQRLSSRSSSTNIQSSSLDAASTSSNSNRSMEVNPNAKPSDEWELDCYSRPVMVGGKKLWEVLITDSTGSFRLCETLPSNKVNSRELRRVVDEAIDSAEVKPNMILFFRGAMFNISTLHYQN